MTRDTGVGNRRGRTFEHYAAVRPDSADDLRAVQDQAAVRADMDRVGCRARFDGQLTAIDHAPDFVRIAGGIELVLSPVVNPCGVGGRTQAGEKNRNGSCDSARERRCGDAPQICRTHNGRFQKEIKNDAKRTKNRSKTSNEMEKNINIHDNSSIFHHIHQNTPTPFEGPESAQNV
ncbi:hypothetical protein [Pandoraea faecigallinarum]|uniref:hypothetical protein n=1 Tax=Pandoraea faecigallinarum TaxID=656179 RepID=UPI001F4615AE|nr:hypothetical protein [Pandoraea faecigallinarum]